MKKLEPEWFRGSALSLAKRLLGKEILYRGTGGVIVETEAYMSDSASHGYRLTPRSQIMHDTFGHVYVYFIYGSYYCLNFTTNKGSVGAVLIRAIEPTAGISKMKRRRGASDLKNLASGPGKLCQALGITKSQNGLPIGKEIVVLDKRKIKPSEVCSATRVGIKSGTRLPWRFYVKDNPFVSKP